MGSYEELKMLQKLPLEVKIKKKSAKNKRMGESFRTKEYIHKFLWRKR